MLGETVHSNSNVGSPKGWPGLSLENILCWNETGCVTFLLDHNIDKEKWNIMAA